MGNYLEIVSERPIAKHFEECMMIAIGSDDIQVIVFATDAYAFLRIGCGATRCYGFIQENIFELQSPKGLACIHSTRGVWGQAMDKVSCI